MPNIFHQSVEDILKAATPEQKIIWNQIFLKYGERLSISQYYYAGVIGAPINIYVARRMFLAYSLIIADRTTGAAGAAMPIMTVYDESNANQQMFYNVSCFWDATAAAARYTGNTITLNNILFSRLGGVGVYSSISIIGYMINY